MPTFKYAKPILNKKIEDTKKILAEIVPSPFFIERELRDSNIVESEAARIRVVQSFYERHGYTQMSTDLLTYMSYCNSNKLMNLICLIAIKLNFNSNKIVLKFSSEDVRNIISNDSNYYRYIAELEKQNIIRRTTKKNVYVVNHEMIFKGSYSDFIKTYLDTYKTTGVMLDSNGKVILDNTIDYAKQ